MKKIGDEECVDSTAEDGVHSLIRTNGPPRGFQLSGPVYLERPTFNLNYYPQMVPPGYPCPCWPADHGTPGFVLGAVPQYFPTMVYGLGSAPPPIPINATGRLSFRPYPRQMDGVRNIENNRAAGVEYAGNTPNIMTPEIEGMPRITIIDSQPSSPEFGHQVVKTVPQNSIRSNQSIPIVQQKLPVAVDKRSGFIKKQAVDRDRCNNASPTVLPESEGKHCNPKNRLSLDPSSIGPRAGQSQIEPEFPKVLRVTSNSSCSSTSLGVLTEKNTHADSCGESPYNDDQVGQSNPVRNTRGSRNITMKGTEVVEISETSTVPSSSYQEDEDSQERAKILYELGNRTVSSLGGSIRCYSAKNTGSAYARAEKTSFPSFGERELFKMPVDRNSLSMKCSFTRVEKSPLPNRRGHSISTLSTEGDNMPAGPPIESAFTHDKGCAFPNHKGHCRSTAPEGRSSMPTGAFMESACTSRREQCVFRRSHPPLDSQNFVASVRSKIFGEMCQHTHINDEECRMMLEPPEQLAMSLSPDDSEIFDKSEIPDEISTSPSSMLHSDHSKNADRSDNGIQNNMGQVLLTKKQQLYGTGAADTDNMVTHFPSEPDVAESGDTDDEPCYKERGKVVKTPLQTNDEPSVSSKMENKDPSLPHAQPKTNSDTTQEKPEICDVLKKDNRVAGFACKFCRRCFPTLNLISDHFVTDHFRDVSTLEAAFGLRYQPVICETCSCPFALCSYCGEAYYSEKGVKKHIQIHKLRKTFKCTYCDKTLERKSHNLHLLVHKGIKPYCGSCSVPFPHSSPMKDNRRISGVAANKHDTPTTRNDDASCRKSSSESAIVSTVGTPTPCLTGKSPAPKFGAKRLIVLVERLETCNAASVLDLIDGSYKGPIKYNYPYSVVNSAKSKKSSTSEIITNIARDSKDSITLGCEDQTPPSGKTRTNDCLSNIAGKHVDDNVGQVAEESEDSAAVQLEGTTPPKSEIVNHANDVTTDSESEEILISKTSAIEPLKCEICAKTFEFLAELSDHMSTHLDGDVASDSASPPEPASSLFQRFSCEVCGIDYDDLEIMSEHMKEHALAANLSDLAQYCQDESDKPGLVQRYYCELCSIDFDDVEILTQHMKEHIANKPEETLKEPLSESSAFTEFNKFQCEICGIDYDDPKILSEHMEEHTKASSDEECGFVAADNSQQEVKKQDEQPCSICKKNVKDLKHHMKTTHACEICGLAIKTEVPEITECSCAGGCFANDGNFESQRDPPAICDRDTPQISENDQMRQDVVEITECPITDDSTKQPSCLPIVCKKKVPESLDCGDHIPIISECPTDDTDSLLKPLNSLSANSNQERTEISEHEISCPICSQLFFDANEYEKHYSYFPFTLDFYLCRNCDGHFLDFASFQSHTNICKSMCAKSRYQPTISSQLIISHLRQLWFLCEKCGSHFSRDRELIRHLDSAPCGVFVRKSDPQRNYELIASNDRDDLFLFQMESVMKQPTFTQKLEVYHAKSSVSNQESLRSSVRDGTQRKVNKDGNKSAKRKIENRQTTDPKRPRIIRTMTKSRLNQQERVKAQRLLKRSVTDNTRRPLVSNVVQSKIGRLLKRERATASQPSHNKLINRKRQRTGTVRRKFAPNISIIIHGVSTEKILDPITENEIQHPGNTKLLQEDPVMEGSPEQTWSPNIVVILVMPSMDEVYLSPSKDSIEDFNAMTVNYEVESQAGFYCRRCDNSFSTLNAFMAHDECKIDADKRFALLKRDQLEMICRICGLKFLVCHFCGKHLSSLRDFKMHAKLHRRGEAFDCTVCRKKLLSHLTPHFAKHHKQTASICKFCDVLNPMKISKWLHNASIVEANFEKYPCLCIKSDCTKYFCDICDTDFVDPQALCNHIQNHEQEKKNNCEICLQGFLRSATLATHKAKEHGIPIEKEKPNMCETCGITFVSIDFLQILLSEPHALFYCKNCNRGFKTINTLNYHNTHVCKKKPYRCENCYKRFTTELALYLHSIKHKELVKKLQCKKCGKCFIFQKTLSFHLKMCGIPLACQKCAKVFLSKELLNAHKKKCNCLTFHETKFPCAECSLTFYTWNVYELHTTNVHERQVPDSCRLLKCDSCSEKFAFEASYGMHLRRHKSEGSFVKGPTKCEDCSHQYNSIMDKMEHICPWECPDCGENVCARKRLKQIAIDRHKAKHNSSKCGSEMTNAEGLEHERDGVADGNQGTGISPVPKAPILASNKDKVNADDCTNTENDSVQAVTKVHIILTTEEKESNADVHVTSEVDDSAEPFSVTTKNHTHIESASDKDFENNDTCDVSTDNNCTVTMHLDETTGMLVPYEEVSDYDNPVEIEAANSSSHPEINVPLLEPESSSVCADETTIQGTTGKSAGGQISKKNPVPRI